MPDALTFVPFATITKVETDPDDPNACYVYGKATSDDLDLDEQIIDRDFARKGMDEWFKSYANIRQMHSPNLPPAGKGVTIEHKDDGVYVRSHVVEPTAVKLCREGVYAAYSVGISRPRIITDKAARNGRIVGGQFVELSLVDRPANTTCKLQLAKLAGANLDELDEAQVIETPDTEKKDYSADDRSDMADSGEAMPDGSYPIKNEADLKNAISSYGRAKDPEKVRAHIIARAKALKLTDLLPANWPGSTKPKGQPTEVFALKRLHDLYCPAYSLDAVKAEYPSVEKDGVAASLGPLAMQSIYQMLLQEVQEDGGSGSESDDIHAIAKTYDLLCDYLVGEAQEAQYDALMAARSHLHKVFRQVNNLSKADAPQPIHTPNPAQFRRPYIVAGTQRENATSPNALSLPMQARVVDASDFQRGPLTAGHESDSPANKDGGRIYYTNAAKDDMSALLQQVHDHLTQVQPDNCPMDGPAEVPQVMAAVVFDNRDDAIPTPLDESRLAAAGTAIKGHKSHKEHKEMTEKQARKLARKLAQAEVAKVQARYDARIGELADMVNKLAAAPDPAQAALRSGETGFISKQETTAETPVITKADTGGDDWQRFLANVERSGRGATLAAAEALAAV